MSATAVEKGPDDVNIIKFLMSTWGGCHSSEVERSEEPHGNNNNGSSATPLISRKMAHELLTGGWVKVNGMPVTDAKNSFVRIGVDVVDVDEAAIAEVRSNIKVWAYFKPEGIDCNCHPNDDSSISGVLARGKLLEHGAFPIGRLDKDSTGLLLLTNSGVLCERLLHPNFRHEKEYLVTINHPRKRVPEAFFEFLRNGVTWYVKGGSTATSDPCTVRAVDDEELLREENALIWNVPSTYGKKKQKEIDSMCARGCSFFITISQGMNRQIRHMVEAAGKKVIGEIASNDDGRAESTDKRPRDGEEGSCVTARTPYRVVRLRRYRIGPTSMGTVFAGKGSQTIMQDESSRLQEITGDNLQQILQWAFE